MSNAYARRTDPATSHEAAHAMDETMNASRLERMVFNIVLDSGDRGATSDEVAQRLGMDLQSITPRFKPLESKGYIFRSEMRRSSLTSNRSRQVWMAFEREEGS